MKVTAALKRVFILQLCFKSYDQNLLLKEDATLRHRSLQTFNVHPEDWLQLLSTMFQVLVTLQPS